MNSTNDDQKFGGKYRIPSARSPHYDYSKNGGYFITICTHQRQCFFGEVVNNQMQLNALGTVVQSEWQKTAEIRSHIFLDEYIVMPNHIHGILWINHHPRRDVLPKPLASKKHPYQGDYPQMSNISPSSTSISTAIRFFKRQTTIYYRQHTHYQTLWQARFYEQVIRDERHLQEIQNYIAYNPAKWVDDCNHPKHLS